MNCRVCLGNTVDLISLGDQYLSDFRVDTKKPPKYPLDLVICEKCKLVQLKETTPSSFLYHDNYGYESGINGLIKEDLSSIVKNALSIYGRPVLNEDSVVIDIGSNDGTLLSFYPHWILKGRDTTPIRVGFDPVSKFKVKAIKHADYIVDDFFSAEKYKELYNQRASIITSISMFYDLDDPNQFVLDIEDILHEKGIWVCQQNYLGTMVSNTAYCNICHEHLEYYSLYSLEKLLNRFDLEVFKVQQNTINGGSFRTFICHKGAFAIDSSVQKMRDEEKKQKLDQINTYVQFAKRIKSLSALLNTLLKRLNNEGKTIYVLGASTRGNTLLQTSKLNNNLIQFAIERNEFKYGKKISSLQIPIISEDEADRHHVDYKLVLPWFLAEGPNGIIERERRYLESGGHLILPLPQLKII